MSFKILREFKELAPCESVGYKAFYTKCIIQKKWTKVELQKIMSINFKKSHK